MLPCKDQDRKGKIFVTHVFTEVSLTATVSWFGFDFSLFLKNSNNNMQVKQTCIFTLFNWKEGVGLKFTHK